MLKYILGLVIRMKKYIPYLIIFILTFIIGFPLLKTKVLNGHDSIFHLFRSYSSIVAIKDGQLIPNINPNMIGGFGYGVNIFYGILTTYITSFLSIFIKHIGLTINIVILCSIFLSGLFMYSFVKELSKNKSTSLLASIIYMISPYFLYDIYVRMAFGEIVCFVFIPLLFHGLYNIIYGDKNKWYLLTIGTSGLFLTHNLSTFLCAIFALLFVLFSYKKVFEKKTIKKLIFSLLLALLISLPTLLPLLEAKISSDYMVFDGTYMHSTGINMEKHSINILKSSSNLPHIMVQGYVLLSIILLMSTFYLKRKHHFNKVYFIFLSLSLISLFLTLNIIPWKSLPNIFSIIQFPFRFLQIFSFFISIVISFIYEKLNNKNIYFLLIIFLCLTCAIPFMRIGIQKNTVDNNLVNFNKLKKRGDIVRSTGSASAEYLPRNAIYNYDYLKERGMYPIVLLGSADINNINKDGTHLSFDIVVNKPSYLELPFIYYPGYLVKINDKKISTLETENGLIGIKIDSGKYHVETKYRGSKIMIISYICCIVGILVLITMILREKRILKKIIY